MGGRKRYVKQMLNVPASRANVKEAFPQVAKKSAGKSNVKTSFGASTLPKKVGIKAVHKTVFGGKSKSSIVPKTPNIFGKKITNIATQPTRKMLGLKG